MASTVPYVQNPAWADGSGGGTPITAAKLNTVEQGVTDEIFPNERSEAPVCRFKRDSEDSTNLGRAPPAT